MPRLGQTNKFLRPLAVFGLLLGLTAIPLAHAQDVPEPADVTDTTEVADAPVTETNAANPEASAFSELLDKWQTQIEATEKEIADPSTTDEELREIPDELEKLREEIVDQRAIAFINHQAEQFARFRENEISATWREISE